MTYMAMIGFNIVSELCILKHINGKRFSVQKFSSKFMTNFEKFLCKGAMDVSNV